MTPMTVKRDSYTWNSDIFKFMEYGFEQRFHLIDFNCLKAVLEKTLLWVYD